MRGRGVPFLCGLLVAVLALEAHAQVPLVQSSGTWAAGAELTFMKPRFDGNEAFQADQTIGKLTTINPVELDYDLALAPRVWVNYQGSEEFGLRASFWEYDQASATADGAVPAGGLLSTPVVDGLFIIAVFGAGETLSAHAGIDAYTVDLEVTKTTYFDAWGVVTSGGVRYASMGQDYAATARDNANAVIHQLSYSNRVEGFGPTIAVETHRPLHMGLTAFAEARASILFGNSATIATDVNFDADPTDPFVQRVSRSSEGLLPIGELRIGGAWISPDTNYGKFIVEGALEGQLWGNVGNNTGQPGDMGFVGLTAGVAWLR